jgi:hypothetical protein
MAMARSLVVGALVLGAIGLAVAGRLIPALPVDDLKLMNESELLAEAVAVCRRAITIWPRTPEVTAEIAADATEYLDRIARVHRAMAGVRPAWHRELIWLVQTELAHTGTVTEGQCAAVRMKYDTSSPK